jgi:hypothetical protein
MTTKNIYLLILICLMSFSCKQQTQTADKEIPHLEKRGSATQLIVDGKPFLVLGGELQNSSSSSREYMKEFWPKLETSGLNTILAAVEWSLVEPVEGKFDFTIVDNLIEDAHAHHLRLVLLWFGSWKNGQTHYAPEWVKKDYNRFPRVKAESGKSLEILTPLGPETLLADSRAFTAMMKHVKEVDSSQRTVIMIQVENEVGVLGSPRDHGDIANAAFNAPVPKELMDYLIKNQKNLLPELIDVWKTTDFKTSGTWEEVFGKGVKADELFMVWNYARYLDVCASKAKAEYSIPMFVNAWLVQPEDKRPGDYPSGGPQAHTLDIWRAGAPNIDLLCPDIHLPDCEGISVQYTRNNNTLFVPESGAGEHGAGNAFYVVGKPKSIGYSPFGIERTIANNDKDPITSAYKMLASLAPVILEAQSKGTITSILLKKDIKESEEIILGNYNLLVELVKNRRSAFVPEQGYGIIINPSPDEYIISGSNIQVSFSPNTPGPAIAAIDHLDEGMFEGGIWMPRRRLNGDDIMLDYDLAKKALENKTGTGLRFGNANEFVQRVKLYRYE